MKPLEWIGLFFIAVVVMIFFGHIRKRILVWLGVKDG